MDGNEKKSILMLLDALTPYIRKLIREETKNCIKTASAIVVSADNTAHTAVVRQIFSDTTMTLRNCTGKDLAADDNVVIFWYGSQTNAWIEIKNDGTAWNT